MPAESRLKVVLCWHMHQPNYRDAASGEYMLPWTYLHAIKDYSDMAAHLENNPAGRAVVNFAPILLEQIDDYARQTRAALNGETVISDPVLAALFAEELPADAAARYRLLNACLRINEERLINRFPAYRRLADMVSVGGEDETLGDWISDQFLTDMLVWYHIAWMGEIIRHRDLRLKALIEKATLFNAADRQVLMEMITTTLESIISRYAALADAGQIELSVTPYAHPILPLLLDFESAHDAMPGCDLPEAGGYPGGEERARWHIEYSKVVFAKYFSHEPRGCWPSEGCVSDATLRLLAESGFEWTASGGKVLANSRAAAQLPTDGNGWQHMPVVIPDCTTQCFFRDDGLSDLIGFTYSKWHADDAVADLVNHLENIAHAATDPEQCVVSIILDGENAWEHYPENGYHFLDALYARLGSHPDLELTTFADCIDAGVAALDLPGLVAGSWVYGTFSTWIGEADKNRGWDLLVEARKVFIQRIGSPDLDPERREQARVQLAVCEGSDWFWWFGDYNPSASVRDFDDLYRKHLRTLYALLDVAPPERLSQVISSGGGEALLGGVMRPGTAS